MKKILLAIAMFGAFTCAFAQTSQKLNTEQSLHKIEISSPTYILVPTENMWIFIKLNTRNGQMWQVQFSMEDNRQETWLNPLKLVEESEEKFNRFILYPTKNTWTFILLDQIDGRTWQVQWSTEEKERALFPIK